MFIATISRPNSKYIISNIANYQSEIYYRSKAFANRHYITDPVFRKSAFYYRFTVASNGFPSPQFSCIFKFFKNILLN